jgi:hypothetical protein
MKDDRFKHMQGDFEREMGDRFQEIGNGSPRKRGQMGQIMLPGGKQFADTNPNSEANQDMDNNRQNSDRNRQNSDQNREIYRLGGKQQSQHYKQGTLAAALGLTQSYLTRRTEAQDANGNVISALGKSNMLPKTTNHLPLPSSYKNHPTLSSNGGGSSNNGKKRRNRTQNSGGGVLSKREIKIMKSNSRILSVWKSDQIST